MRTIYDDVIPKGGAFEPPEGSGVECRGLGERVATPRQILRPIGLRMTSEETRRVKLT
jgi:hypothetical protein